jgi:hypothetical protein
MLKIEKNDLRAAGRRTKTLYMTTECSRSKKYRRRRVGALNLPRLAADG